MIKSLLFAIEDQGWSIRCGFNLWLHGPYGLSKTIEKIPFRFLVNYLRKYGASIGENCRFERGINIHRPDPIYPFKNLKIGDDVYMGHNTLIDLSNPVEIKDKVIIASYVQIWTHASKYDGIDYNNLKYSEDLGSVLIEHGTIIYSGVVISHGVKIGRMCKIGANSLVNKNIPDLSFAGGVPIKIIDKK